MIGIVEWAVRNTRVVLAMFVVVVVAGVIAFIADSEGSPARHSHSGPDGAGELSRHQPGG